LRAMVCTAVLTVVTLIQAEKNVVFVVRSLCHDLILVLSAALT
jgi:hypothetical protein